jgi:uncharacterized protein YyaL (SSP411 family)
VTDNAIPSGTSLAVYLLARMAELTGDAELRRRVGGILESLAEPMAQHPAAFGHLLGAADMVVHGAVAVALVGPPAGERFQELARVVAGRYVPSIVLAGGESGGKLALLEGREMIDEKATAYVCRHFACELPVTGVDALEEQLERASSAQTRT